MGIQEWVLWNASSRFTEDALEPLGGFTSEPSIRVGNQVVPVGRRFDFIDTTKALEVPVDTTTVEPDSTVAPQDTTVVEPDTVRRPSPGSAG